MSWMLLDMLKLFFRLGWFFTMHWGSGDELDTCAAKKPEEPVVSVKDPDAGRQREVGTFAFLLVVSMKKGKGDIPPQE